MIGSGFEEIVIDSGICASGSIEQVMKGKHYNRALRTHNILLEDLERLLFEVFENHAQCGNTIQSVKCEMKDILSNPNSTCITNP